MFRYLVEVDKVFGRPDLFFAFDKDSEEKVLLEFYESRQRFEKSKELNLMLQDCDYVCR